MGIAYPKREIALLLYSQTLRFWNHFYETFSILILNGSGTSIHFVNGKMGRKITGGNAAVYPDIKTAVGIHDRIQP